MPINSRTKGKAGELEWRDVLRKMFPKLAERIRRGQQHSGSPESPDVVGVPGVHWEVKRTNAFRLRESLAQAARYAGPNVPVVAQRGNRQAWVVCVEAEHLPALARAVVKALGDDDETRTSD